jgi:predicted DNA-binding protein (UPF0251 family)
MESEPCGQPVILTDEELDMFRDVRSCDYNDIRMNVSAEAMRVRQGGPA